MTAHLTRRPGRGLRVAVVGTGLVGASLAGALRRLPQVAEVVGADQDPRSLQVARERGLIDRAEAAVDAAAAADLVVLAAPVSTIPRLAETVGAVMRPGAVLTDVASVKGRLVPRMEDAVADGVAVVGGHPMAGSHEAGAAHASPELFVGATWLLTPTQRTDPAAFERLQGLLVALGARVLAVDPDRHDELVAVVSHLPQLVGTTLMNLAAGRAARSQELLLLAAGGFRDATRVAASNPELWVEICAENRDAIVALLDEYRVQLDGLRDIVEGGDHDRLRSRLADARRARRALPGKRVPDGALVELRLPIPDRPGVLAEITTSVGEMGVNIEDIGIEHAPESARGTVRLAVAGHEAATRARAALQGRGYDVLEAET